MHEDGLWEQKLLLFLLLQTGDIVIFCVACLMWGTVEQQRHGTVFLALQLVILRK
jgi:hypothetical protein